ncbi:MAG: phenylacetate--CoA ligase family protein [Chloroflexi bacterium]|nr:phenylacetate--CoA ligase family protein [Chloroflexota bacterium]
MASILHRAATQVPYYKRQWSDRRRLGDKASWEILENWPILKKEDIRANPEAFIADDQSVKALLADRTGGTTGTPLKVWLSRETNIMSYAIFEARTRRWHGVSRYEPWATMGGQLVIKAQASHPPYWVKNYALHQTYFSTNHISRHTAPVYLNTINQHKITNIVAYTASITYLAQQIHELGLLSPPTLKLVVTNAEGLNSWQRQIIEWGLNCRTCQTYGMVELVACASEHPNTGADLLHIWPEMGIIEVFQDEIDVPAKSGEVGRFICTGLLNPDMPLIRYEVGDRGSVKAVSSNTSEFAYPQISRIEGRQTDMLISPEGHRVWYFNPLFSGLPIVEAQVVQEQINEVRILYVPARDFHENHKNLILKRLYDRMGKVNVQFEEVDKVPRESNGKFRLVVCKVILAKTD